MRKPLNKPYLWMAIVLALLALITTIIVGQVQDRHQQSQKMAAKILKNQEQKLPYPDKSFPACPKSISGILTAPLMDPKYISNLTPLGNINPPGHTSPVDHIYFATNFRGRIPLLAPANATITAIIETLQEDGTGKYLPTGYVVTYVVCDGLVLDFASYTELVEPLQKEISLENPDCHYGIVKPGHVGGAEGQCGYQISYTVKAGQQIGWVQAVNRGGSYDLPFEIWAANYNVPERSDVNWSYYNDNRYAHAFCLFDLYSGELKKSFYSKFGGRITTGTGNSKNSVMASRTIAPVCGEVNQDIVGTLQGMWFGGPVKTGESLEFQGKGLAFLHNNIDPNQGEISVGGEITGNAGIIMFKPNHVGLFNREPSEVRADGNIYCYGTDQGGTGLSGKILVQLIDPHHLKVEHLVGTCTAHPAFENPYIYQR